MKITLDELQAFVAVVDAGSITAAAEHLEQTVSGISRTLARLETKLDTTLLRRTTRRLELTEEGRGLIDALVPPAFLRKAEEALGERSAALVDLLRELLATVQRQENVPGFGLCRTCRFHQQLDDGALCRLTGERLESGDGELICREHAEPEPVT